MSPLLGVVKEVPLKVTKRDGDEVCALEAANTDNFISEHYLQIHQRLFWTSMEHNLKSEQDQFNSLPPGVQLLLFEVFMILATGDQIVTGLLDSDENIKLKWDLATRMMFASQADREYVHEKSYTDMAKLYTDFKKTATVGYRNSLLSLKFDNLFANTKANFLFFMMLCEKCLFHDLFTTVQLLNGTGILTKCVDITMMVMRDERIHYEHVLALLREMDGSEYEDFPRMLEMFYEMVMDMYEKLWRNMTHEEQEKHRSNVKFSFNQLINDLPKIQVTDFMCQFKPHVSNPYNDELSLNLVKDEKTNLMERNAGIYALTNAVLPNESIWSRDEPPNKMSKMDK